MVTMPIYVLIILMIAPALSYVLLAFTLALWPFGTIATLERRLRRSQADLGAANKRYWELVEGLGFSRLGIRKSQTCVTAKKINGGITPDRADYDAVWYDPGGNPIGANLTAYHILEYFEKFIHSQKPVQINRID